MCNALHCVFSSKLSNQYSVIGGFGFYGVNMKLLAKTWKGYLEALPVLGGAIALFATMLLIIFAVAFVLQALVGLL